MPIPTGTRLGPYEIVALIGEGGMGEVYDAQDTRLGRSVAIKVLSESVSPRPDGRERFEREAKAISQLNHPHICTLHDVGEHEGLRFIVMERIDGETLGSRLSRSSLTLTHVFEYGAQIANGLAAAHRAGVIHRDLKPGNIMITDSGIKLVDFGLARLLEEPASAVETGDASDAPTRAQQLTRAETIVGTLAYMAPEQLEGREVDARTDVFALGAVLYEMSTGKAAFVGDSQAGVISAVLSKEPLSITELRPDVPRRLAQIIRRCLAKQPEERWHAAKDVALELGSIDEPSSPATTNETKGRGRWAWAPAAVIALLLGWYMGGRTERQTQTEPSALRLAMPLPPGEQLLGGVAAAGGATPFDISPDGQTIVFASENGGSSQLYLRSLNAFDATPLPNTGGASAPRFSPDGQSIGFVVDYELRRVSLDGTEIGRPAESFLLAGSNWDWHPDGGIVRAGASGVARISRDGEEDLLLVGEPGTSYHAPQVLPDGETVLVSLWGSKSGEERIALVSGEERVARTLIGGYVGARYLPSGHLLLRKPGTGALSAVAFDAATQELTGIPVPVVDGVYASPRSGLPHYAVSASGVLVFAPTGLGGTELVWVERDGRATSVSAIPPSAYTHPRISPDGRRVAVDDLMDSFRDVWVYDLAIGTRTRLSSEGDFALGVWNPDGNRIAYFSTEPSGFALYSRVADAATPPELMLAHHELRRFPISWSPDGKTLAITEQQPDATRDILLVENGEVRPYLATAAHELSPQFSPDGRYIAYVSDESGREEIYVRSFPDGGQRWPISTDGGVEPLWSRDGRELFYRKGFELFAVTTTLSPTFQPSRPRLLFDAPYFMDTAGHPAYDVAADGRFLMIRENDEERTELHVVLGWRDELERLVPASN